MHTIIAAVTVSESGSVVKEVYSDEQTYNSWVTPNNYGSPYLGAFETSEDWRAALGQYVIKTAADLSMWPNPHGERLVYVSPQCSMYVFEIDFDS